MIPDTISLTIAGNIRDDSGLMLHLNFPLVVTRCLKGKWCGTLGTSGEFLEGHDQLGTLGITNKLLGVAPLELPEKLLKGTTKLAHLTSEIKY